MNHEEGEVTKRHRIRIDKLAGFLSYVLGRRPDEFGLVPDLQGYIPVKRLLQALREEPGWAHVGQGLLREVLLSEHRHSFESDEKRIRAMDRHFRLDLENQALPPKGVLFTPVRKRAHFHALEKGLPTKPNGEFYLLTEDTEMAYRIGRRFDPSPVLLEIRVPQTRNHAMSLHHFGKFFLSPHIPETFIEGPPLGREELKELDKKAAERPAKDRARPIKTGFEAGTFVLDGDRDPDRSRARKIGKKRRSWKEDARKIRRYK